jgi:hypothetical protein
MFGLGPIGLLLAAIVVFGQPRIRRIYDYPAIVHHDGMSKRTTVLLVLEQEVVCENVLSAFAHLAPDTVSAV